MGGVTIGGGQMSLPAVFILGILRGEYSPPKSYSPLKKYLRIRQVSYFRSELVNMHSCLKFSRCTTGLCHKVYDPFILPLPAERPSILYSADLHQSPGRHSGKSAVDIHATPSAVNTLILLTAAYWL